MAKVVSVTKNMIGIEWLMAVQLVLSYEWIKAGYEKFSKPDFMDHIEKTLGVFASPKNPHHAYVNYLKSSVVPNAETFGQVVRFGEIAGGLVLLAGAVLAWRGGLSRLMCILLAITCILLAILNWNFYMASGWSSPAGAGENTIMGLIELILGAFYIKQSIPR